MRIKRLIANIQGSPQDVYGKYHSFLPKRLSTSSSVSGLHDPLLKQQQQPPSGVLFHT